jgi:hypothetical protein
MIVLWSLFLLDQRGDGHIQRACCGRKLRRQVRNLHTSACWDNSSGIPKLFTKLTQDHRKAVQQPSVDSINHHTNICISLRIARLVPSDKFNKDLLC